MCEKEKLKMVRVEWIDAHSHTQMNWQSLEVISEPQEVLVNISLGFLLHDGPGSKVLVPHVYASAEDGDPPASGCGWMSIPEACVLSMDELGPVRKMKRGKK